MLIKNLLYTDQNAIDTVAPDSASALDAAIKLAKTQLLGLQHQQGFWVFELEADCTIPAEYILMKQPVYPGMTQAYKRPQFT